MKKVTLLLYCTLFLAIAMIGSAKAASGICSVGGPVVRTNQKYVDTDLPTRVKFTATANCRFIHKGNTNAPFTDHSVEFEIRRTDIGTPTEWVMLMSELRKQLEKECQEQGCNK